MKNLWMELVYDSMQGSLVVPLPQVENEFAPGSRCEVLYGDVLAAYGRLCQRLGQVGGRSGCGDHHRFFSADAENSLHENV